jgi:hypothetical protein
VLVVDDALLLLVLAGAATPLLDEAFAAGEMFTTSTWYYRLANALRSRRVEGALTTAFRALAAPEQRLVEARLQMLPPSIGLLDYRKLVLIMTALDVEYPVNMLAADAIATAIVIDGRILVRTDAPLIRAAAFALRVDYTVM